MITIIPVLILLFIILVMVTLGAVLLARFVLGPSSASRRTLAAVIGGPLTLIVPSLGVSVAQGSDASATNLALAFLIVLVVLAGLCWPLAHFATRRLDRLTAFDPKIFE